MATRNTEQNTDISGNDLRRAERLSNMPSVAVPRKISAATVKKVLREQWSPLLTSLAAERSSVRSSLAFVCAASLGEEYITARRNAFKEYDYVLETLHEKLTQHMRNHELPSVLVKDKALPFDGVHWADWVPEKVKLAVVAIFEAVPYIVRAKRKVLFLRVFPARVWAMQCVRLRDAIAREIRSIEVELSVFCKPHPAYPVAEGRELKLQIKLTDLFQAGLILDLLPEQYALPRTWHGLKQLSAVIVNSQPTRK